MLQHTYEGILIIVTRACLPKKTKGTGLAYTIYYVQTYNTTPTGHLDINMALKT